VLALLAVLILHVEGAAAFAQVRRIQGKVVDEHGKPVPTALIEAAIVSIADDGFVVQRTEQTWKTHTNAAGDFTVTVPRAGEYVITATKDGVGSERAKVAVPRSGLVTAILTLWKPPAPTNSSGSCGPGKPTGSFASSPHVAGAARGLVLLIGWVEAVQLHVPGCADPAAIDVGHWPLRDLEVLSRDVRELAKFLERADAARSDHAGRGSMQREQIVFFIYNRRFTFDELERSFFRNQPLRANDLLKRGAVLHADIAALSPGNLGRYPLVEDGSRRGWRGASSHWEIGRQLLDGIIPAPNDDSGALLWYRAVSAYLLRAGNLAELGLHLNRARRIFGSNPDLLFDSARLHQELSSPAIQASVEHLRANAVNVVVGTRTAELRRVERFLRGVLALAPDHAEARVRLGHTLGELGRHTEAATELRNAINAAPDKARRYLAELFLGRQLEALGQQDEATSHYELAAAMYPAAQSPRLALSRLARHTGDRAGAQRVLQTLTAVPAAHSDPWWEYYESHTDDADALMERLRAIGN
jgi:tetratricopeptide (TPR) repeat protein